MFRAMHKKPKEKQMKLFFIVLKKKTFRLECNFFGNIEGHIFYSNLAKLLKTQCLCTYCTVASICKFGTCSTCEQHNIFGVTIGC